MAEIYLARQRSLEGLERTVVIKRILPSYIDNPEFVTMFLDEARLLAALSHPNIAQVFDLGKIDDSYYLVMEYVRGPTLGALLQAAAKKGRMGGLPERAALAIALRVAEALAYVHDRRDEVGRPLNIVHRDLNPANVIVSYDGAVKLIDFGIAKAATKVYETRTGVIKGTYGYIAPEQLTRNAPVDHRADVFALGVLLYEMCVGEHPFDVSDEPNLIDRILNASYKRPRQVSPTFPRILDRLIASCLSPHPEGRPEDVASLIEALTRYMGDRQMVPTMRDISRLAHSLVPDTEGPTPLKPLTASQIRRPFGVDPSRTMKLPHQTGDEDAPTILEAAPNLADLLEDSQEMTIRLATPDPDEDDDEAAETIIAPMSRDERRRLMKEGLRSELSDLSGAHTNKLPPVSGEHTDPSAGRLRVASERRRAVKAGRTGTGLRRAAMFAASVLLVGGVGVLAFMTARAIGERDSSRPTELAAAPGNRALEEEPGQATIEVLSEPAGAAVSMNGEDVGSTTPTSITLPEGVDAVWIRVAMPGYITQEREVQATVGAARFVLTQIEVVDAGGAESDDEIEEEEAAAPTRPLPRRRRRRN